MIRRHEFNDVHRCVHCGALWFERLQEVLRRQGVVVPSTDARQCLERSDAGLRPEPVRRTFAVEDADIIGRRMKEIAAEAEDARNRPESTALDLDARLWLPGLFPRWDR